MTQTIKITNDARLALQVIAGQRGMSIDLMRQRYGTAGMSDADLIDALREPLGLGHIVVQLPQEPLTAADMAWLASHAFRTDGAMLHSDAAEDDRLQYTRGDKLSPTEQRKAVALWLRPSADWPSVPARYERG